MYNIVAIHRITCIVFTDVHINPVTRDVIFFDNALKQIIKASVDSKGKELLENKRG